MTIYEVVLCAIRLLLLFFLTSLAMFFVDDACYSMMELKAGTIDIQPNACDGVNSCSYLGRNANFVTIGTNACFWEDGKHS